MYMIIIIVSFSSLSVMCFRTNSSLRNFRSIMLSARTRLYSSSYRGYGRVPLERIISLSLSLSLTSSRQLTAGHLMS